jgi:uncharacterized protein YraI
MKWRHLLFLLAAATLPAGPVAAQPVAVTATELSLYAGPGNSYPEVLRLTPRVPVKVHACMPDYAWCEVSYGNDRGWALASSLTYDDRGARVPLAMAAAGAGIPVSGFEIESYWGVYYTGRPWYGDRHRWQNRPDARPPSGPPAYRPPGIGLRPPSDLPSRPAGAPIGGPAAEPRGQGLSR